MIWVEPRWKVFWGRFGHDNQLYWPAFQEFVKSGGSFGKQYQLGKWTGDTRVVFELLCEEGCEYITTRKALEARHFLTASRDTCEWGFAGLRKLLIAKFGSMAAAWRRVFDPENSGRCGKVHFLQSVRANGFHGSLNTTWAEITAGEIHSVVRLADFDPEVDGMMADFAEGLVERYGSLKHGWDWVMSHAHGKIHIDKFEEILAGIGFSRKSAKKIFQCFDPMILGIIYQSETPSPDKDHLAFLKYWDPAGPNAGYKNSPKPAAQAGTPDDDSGVIGIDAPALTFEFTVVLTKEEYNEYLRRRRSLRDANNRTGGGAPPIAISPQTQKAVANGSTSPKSTTLSAPGSPALNNGTTFGSAGMSVPPSAQASPGPPTPRSMTRPDSSSYTSPTMSMRSPRSTPQQGSRAMRPMPGQESRVGSDERPKQSTLNGILSATHAH